MEKIKNIFINEQKIISKDKSATKKTPTDKKPSSDKVQTKTDKKPSVDKSQPDKPKEDKKVTPSDIKIKIFSPGREQLHIDNWEFVRAIQKSIESNNKDNKVY
jgi:hypothetical protein